MQDVSVDPRWVRVRDRWLSYVHLVKVQWPEISSAALLNVRGSHERLAACVAETYGLSLEQARSAVDYWLDIVHPREKHSAA